MRFVKIFWGNSFSIEDEINETAEKENLKIISVSTCIENRDLYVTVVFEEQNEEE